MIAPIYIDLSGVIDEFILSKEETTALSAFVLDNIGDEYMRVWETNIDNLLHQTRSEYKNAIFVERPDDFSLIFGMTPRQSKLGMMLEEGASQFDIKEGFKKSDKKKFKANGGWYLTIPFRHATSSAVAESAIFSSKMPNRIEQLVKASKSPLKLNQLPKGYREVKTSHTGYVHKSAIYEGLHRRDISTGKEKRGGYYTFRRVSDISEDNSWIHPGFKALNLMDKSLNDLRIDFIVDKAVDQFLIKKFTG